MHLNDEQLSHVNQARAAAGQPALDHDEADLLIEHAPVHAEGFDPVGYLVGFEGQPHEGLFQRVEEAAEDVLSRIETFVEKLAAKIGLGATKVETEGDDLLDDVVEDVKGISNTPVKPTTADDPGALSTTTAPALATTQIETLSTTTAPALATTQIEALSTVQVAALTSSAG
jgi:hypothetical protein